MMCVMNYLLRPGTYRTSHGSHTQNLNLTEVILTAIYLWLFLLLIYINKVCDVCDDRQRQSYRGFATHRLTYPYVRNTCCWAKSLIRLQEVLGLNKNASSLRGLLQCKPL